MKIESPLPTYIGYEVGFFNDQDLIEWAIKYLPNSEYFSDDQYLVELVSINIKKKFEVEKAITYLKVFINKQWPEFILNSEKSEIYAKKYFKIKLQKYLLGECKPYDVCKMINPIEEIFDFPNWLGNMYNACDWVELETKSVDCRHLESEVENTLKL